jgi:hypothetical protein
MTTEELDDLIIKAAVRAMYYKLKHRVRKALWEANPKNSCGIEIKNANKRKWFS